MSLQHCLRLLFSLGLIGFIFNTVSVVASSAEEEPSQAAVRRFDPKTDGLVPVKPDEIVPGKLYNHYSHRHSRYVWAYAKEGGEFSYALGPGSTELPENFDVAGSRREVTELLKREAAEWFGESRREGREIMVRLGADGRWKVLKFRSIRSHFDLDTGLRWEWHGKRKVAVSHTYGYLWRFRDDRYLPAGGGLVAAVRHSPYAACTCGACALR